jgi:putative transposase
VWSSSTIRGQLLISFSTAWRRWAELDRDFTASAPNLRWVADITYIATWHGFCYVAFVLDLYSRRIVGWRVSNSLRADLALDARTQPVATRPRERDADGLVHHSERGTVGGFNRLSQ